MCPTPMLRKEFTIKWKIYICTWIHKYQYTNTRIFSVRNPWHISSDNLSAVVQFLTTRVSSQLILSSEVSVSLLLIVEENIKGYIEHIQSIAVCKNKFKSRQTRGQNKQDWRLSHMTNTTGLDYWRESCKLRKYEMM